MKVNVSMSGVIIPDEVKDAWTQTSFQKKNETDEEKESNSIAQTYSTLRRVLKLAGLHCELRARHRQAPWTILTLKGIHLIVVIAMNLFLLLNTVRLAYVLVAEKDKGISTTLMAAYAIVLYKTCYLYASVATAISLAPNFESLVSDLGIYEEKYASSELKHNRPIIVRRILIIYMIAVLTFVIGMGFILFYTLDDSIIFRKILLFFPEMKVSRAESIAFVIIVELIVFNHQFAETLVLHETVSILKKRFADICQKIKRIEERQETSEETQISVHTVRRQFESLHAVVIKVDKCFSHFIAMSFPNGMGVICLTMYGFFVDHLSYVDGASMILFILKSSSQLVSVIIAGIVLNNKIHEPLNYLHGLDFYQLSDRAIQEVSVFIARLSGSQIGLTVHGLFVIDKSTILMVLGTILTYAIVILQLKPDDRTDTIRNLLHSSNCTSF